MSGVARLSGLTSMVLSLPNYPSPPRPLFMARDALPTDTGSTLLLAVSEIDCKVLEMGKSPPPPPRLPALSYCHGASLTPPGPVLALSGDRHFFPGLSGGLFHSCVYVDHSDCCPPLPLLAQEHLLHPYLQRETFYLLTLVSRIPYPGS